MNLKNLYILLSIAVLASSCSYLDVVPPEQADIDDMLVDEATTVKMLYSCYSYAQMPDNLPMAKNFDMGGQTRQ